MLGSGVHGPLPSLLEPGKPDAREVARSEAVESSPEGLHGEEFDSVLEAHAVLQEWVGEYNQRRPHRRLGMMTPHHFAESWKAGAR